MPRNPYHDNSGAPVLRRSIFVFMDILGYREMIRVSESNGTTAALLRDLHSALQAARKTLEDQLNLADEFDVPRRYALKAFTDNIVIGWPINQHDDGESEYGEAVEKLAAFQFTMASHGYFVRGSLTIGDAFVDELAVFGPALTETYRFESEVAVWPRIVLTESMTALVQQHMGYYGVRAFAPQAEELLSDVDDRWFVDYLRHGTALADVAEVAEDEYIRHRDFIARRLDAFRADNRVWPKYAWLAKYHNYFVREHQYFADHVEVDEASLQGDPRLRAEYTFASIAPPPEVDRAALEAEE